MSIPAVPGRTTTGFAFTTVERALWDSLGRRRFGRAEIAEVLRFFGAPPISCVFCGSPEVRRWDHLVPVRAGGETVLGNMVPACSRCDDSKGRLAFYDWMRSSVSGSPASSGVPDIEQRITRLHAYAAAYSYTPRSLEERLTPEEHIELTLIRANLLQARQHMEELIRSYHARISLD